VSFLVTTDINREVYHGLKTEKYIISGRDNQHLGHNEAHYPCHCGPWGAGMAGKLPVIYE
jgi:hypothetical protein